MITIYSPNAYLLQSDAIIWYAILMPCYEFFMQCHGICMLCYQKLKRKAYCYGKLCNSTCMLCNTFKRDHKIIIRPVTQLKLELNLWFA